MEKKKHTKASIYRAMPNNNNNKKLEINGVGPRKNDYAHTSDAIELVLVKADMPKSKVKLKEKRNQKFSEGKKNKIASCTVIQ